MKTCITKIMETETGHRLVDYIGKCAHIHGHRYVWEVTVTSHQLDETGFVTDYGVVKAIMKKVVDPLDHAFVISELDPLVKLAIEHKVFPDILLCATNGETGRVFVVPFNPTSENLIDWVAPKIDKQLPIGLYLHRIKLWETSSSYAEREFATCV